ncbi:helix-turn-helix domain-containing protein [Poriferisphaera sp. WC338]|uniref:helix-turn-helix domain-containing protein n=1 Tax=Poriferisphaera sp. WC338 TaxID=3425129 RepID=UPI003D8134BC
MTVNPSQFGKLLYAPVANGLIAKLKDSDVRTLYVLTAHVSGNGWTARPSVERLARLSGLGERTVQRALRRLTMAGLVEVIQSRGRKPNVYRVVTNPVTVMTGLDDAQPRHQRTSTLSLQAPNPVTGVPQPCQSCDIQTEEQREQKEQREEVVVGDGVDGVWKIAERVGVKEPGLSAIVQSGITAQGLIVRAVNAPDGVGNLAGYLVNEAKRAVEEGDALPAITTLNIRDAVRKGWVETINGHRLADGVAAKFNEQGVYVYRGGTLQETIWAEQMQGIVLS